MRFRDVAFFHEPDAGEPNALWNTLNMKSRSAEQSMDDGAIVSPGRLCFSLCCQTLALRLHDDSLAWSSGSSADGPRSSTDGSGSSADGQKPSTDGVAVV